MKRLPEVIAGVLLSLLFSGQSRAGVQPVLMRMMADGNLMHNETDLYFDSAGSYAYNSLLDATSLGVAPGQLNIVSLLNGVEYQVKALPLLQQNISVPIKISTGTTGIYNLYATELQNLSHACGVYLYDSYSNTTFNLRSGSCQCIISDTETIARFTLQFVISSISPLAYSVVPPKCLQSADGKILLNVPQGNQYDFFWKDSLNNIIDSTINQSIDSITFLNSGIYRADINISGTHQGVVQYFSLVPTSSPIANFSIPGNPAILTSNAASVQFTNESNAATSYWWDFGDGMGCDSVSPMYDYVQLGSYTVTLTASNNVCPETSGHSEVVTVQGGTTSVAAISNSIEFSRDEKGFYLRSKSFTKASIDIIDPEGRKTWTGEILLEPDRKSYLNADARTSQVLFIHVQTPDVQKIYKLIDQR